MVVDGIHAGGHNYVSNWKTQVLTKYVLLERIASALNCQPWVVPRPDRVQSNEVIHAKMKPILKSTARWPRVIEIINQHIATAGAAPAANIAPPPQPLADAQVAQLRALKLLDGAQRSSRESEYYNVESNVQQAAFMVHWHATVSCYLHLGGIHVLTGHLEAQYSIPTRQQLILQSAFGRVHPNWPTTVRKSHRVTNEEVPARRFV